MDAGRIVLLAAFLLLVVVVLPSDAACPDGYVKNRKSSTCLKLITRKKSWTNAKRYCGRHDGYLAVLNSEKEIKWFQRLCKKNKEWKKAGPLWIGGEKEGKKWVWNGRTTKRIKAKDWAKSEPDGEGNCLMVLGKRDNFQWGDEDCKKKWNFVCEIKE